MLHKVKFQLDFLEWGGEYISNSYQYVYGYVHDFVIEGIKGMTSFEIDFGAGLSIQFILVMDCQS